MRKEAIDRPMPGVEIELPVADRERHAMSIQT